jgi:hypothetical protein
MFRAIKQWYLRINILYLQTAFLTIIKVIKHNGRNKLQNSICEPRKNQ